MRNVRLLLGAAMLALPVSSIPAPVLAAQAETSAFALLSKRYVDGLARLNPSSATALGDHRFDTQITDMSAGGRAKREAFSKAMLADLQRIDRKALSREEQVDAALLDNALRYDIWDTETLGGWAWDPQVYNDIAGSSL